MAERPWVAQTSTTNPPEPKFWVALLAAERQALFDLCIRELERKGCQADPVIAMVLVVPAQGTA
jgi:hypothetical protein